MICLKMPKCEFCGVAGGIFSCKEKNAYQKAKGDEEEEEEEEEEAALTLIASNTPLHWS